MSHTFNILENITCSDLNSIIDNIRAAIFITDKKEYIIYANKTCTKYLKHTIDTFIGKKIKDFLISEDHIKLKSLMNSNDDKNYWELNFKTGNDDYVLLNCYKFFKGDLIFLIARYNDPRITLLQDELMLINNQMTNLNREIEKKNKQLMVLNDKLEQQKYHLYIKNKVLNNQLSMAKKIQQHLVKKETLNLYNLIFKMDYIPAYHIGGDYFDVVDLKNGKVGVFMSDVSGHGISAALIMAIIKTIFSKQKNYYENPSKLFFYMNKEFNEIFGESFDEIYCAAFYCVIDTVNMKIKYCNAGNPGAYIFDKKTITKMDKGNFPIGMFKFSEYKNNQIAFSPKDKIAFFTDGYEEIVLHSKYENIDNESVIKILNENCLTKIVNSNKKIRDDISIIVVEYNTHCKN
ncbi:SpoIIE family protein phosphatase [Herbivorax sp. ANBcel31]|uniref:SpoIIE family protein phosphatase n=1 Tax=Herbivorax sp. ANBcel31 TaxID=3069754 RepID=UPI0027B80341|nr:SpoIIE family protein phosphatase [Herbivorax sp. ANBcel31]MDQ2086724.1 SpoIIE family protein phosphatase [Herbivorax sp. ANBcel31]